VFLIASSLCCCWIPGLIFCALSGHALLFLFPYLSLYSRLPFIAFVLASFVFTQPQTLNRWESAEKLHKQALSTPSDFAGLHYPFVLRFTGDIVSGVLNPDRDDKMVGVIGSFTEYRGDGEFQTSKDPDYQDKVLSDVNVWSRSAGEDVGRVLNATERVMANRLRNRAGAGKQ
jgi:hypothetical protein